MTKAKAIVPIFIACVSIGVLLAGSCAGLLLFGFKDVKSQVSPKIDAMFSAIDNNTFAETYESETTQSLRESATKDQYTAVGDLIRLRLGKLKSKSLQGFTTTKYISGSSINVSYDATFENGNGTIIAKLKKEDGTWKFVVFRVTSPVFAQDIETGQNKGGSTQ
ncbi:hypothetical protein CA13_01640 [Planctomycetes bacterium CA13]|uniref:DUF4878 domain-containing protein n=1 Tax=Novipirellula herctigrandis TaxID=2527986 RepID=A0A5C5YW57_9BACT|nr:hypothetical protein CA13_01640 [Planctomycetes bacterium CA13]